MKKAIFGDNFVTQMEDGVQLLECKIPAYQSNLLLIQMKKKLQVAFNKQLKFTFKLPVSMKTMVRYQRSLSLIWLGITVLHNGATMGQLKFKQVGDELRYAGWKGYGLYKGGHWKVLLLESFLTKNFIWDGNFHKLARQAIEIKREHFNKVANWRNENPRELKKHVDRNGKVRMQGRKRIQGLSIEYCFRKALEQGII